MEQKFINSCASADHIQLLKAKIIALETQKKRLQQELKFLQNNCEHEFVETAIMRTCQKCKWSESMYY